MDIEFIDGILHVNTKATFKVPEVELSESVKGIGIVDSYSDRHGWFKLYENGYVYGETIAGKYNLKILEK